jgi:phenylpropionate dioxygenase-like ring-hydroxylating dioxygenase large terminal subunit
METTFDPALSGQWMAVAICAEVDAPVRVTVMGHHLVLWRHEGEIRAFDDLCVHRGTALSLGRVEAGCLVCPYHGWRYDGDGRCVAIPAHPDTPISSRAQAVRRPCVERNGLVWVCIGEPDSPLPPRFAEGEADGFRSVICGPYVVDAEAPRVIENFLDIAHLMWVHEGLLGVPERAAIPDYRVRREGDRLVTDVIRIYQPDPDGRGSDVMSDYVYEIMGPLTVMFRKRDDDATLAIMLHTTPLGDCSTQAFAVLSRNYAFDIPDSQFVEFQDTIFAQDVRILMSQRPEKLPLDLAAEMHLKSDRLAIAYREELRRLGVRFGTA